MDQERRVAKKQPAEPPRRPRPPQKKKKRGFTSPWVYLLFVFGVSAILAALSWTAANDVLALNKVQHEDAIIVGENDSFDKVVDQLKDKGIIQYKGLFKTFATVVGGKDKITMGTYLLDTDMDYRAIINGLGANSDSRMEVEVTIPEGYTVDQIFALLEKKGVSTTKKLQDMAATHNYAFSFLQDIPLGSYQRLEGYLFPDTYRFYMGENPLYVINKMLVNFDLKFTEAMRTKVGNSKYSIREMLIIASMIDKETDGGDRENLSSVMHNRLEKPNSETAGFLNVDATIQYVLPEGEIVNQSHYQSVDSPYNTYLHKGLPPGPVGNPGLDAIYAAMNPANTGYYFYSLGKDGKHHFFKTNAEHTAFVASQQ